MPVKNEDVELLESWGGEQVGKGWTVYWFKISRYAEWEYVMQLKNDRPPLSFFKIENSVKGGINVFATYEHAVDRRTRVIFPYNRNEVIYLSNI